MSWAPYLCKTCERHPDVKRCIDDPKCIHFVGSGNEAEQPILHSDPDALPFEADVTGESEVLA